MVAIGNLNLGASPKLFFIGGFCGVLDFITSLFDLLPGFFHRLIDLLAGAFHGALFFLAEDQSDSTAGIGSPGLTVAPGRQGANEQKNQNDDQDGSQDIPPFNPTF